MKKHTSKKIKKSVIRSIGLSVLFNRGNYENVKYDLICDVPKGGNARQTLLDMAGILMALRPIKKSHDVDYAREIIAKESSTLSVYEKEHFEEYLETVNHYEARLARRNAALEKLDDIGGSSVEKDAKLTWDDNDTPF